MSQSIQVLNACRSQSLKAFISLEEQATILKVRLNEIKSQLCNQLDLNTIQVKALTREQVLIKNAYDALQLCAEHFDDAYDALSKR